MLLYAFERGHKVTSYTTLVGMKIKDIEQFKHIPFEAFNIHLPDMQKYAKIAVNSHYLDLLEKLISCDIQNLSYMTMGALPPEIQRVLGTSFQSDVMINRAGNNKLGRATKKKFGPIVCSVAYKNGTNILNHNILLPNGDVCMCCMDYGMDYIFGNLIRSDYNSLFESKEFHDIQEKMRAEDSNIMCRNCNVSIHEKDVIEDPHIQILFCDNCAQSFYNNNIGGYSKNGKAICKECSVS